MFLKKSDTGYRPAAEKIEIRTLAHGEKTLMAEFRMKKGALLPHHSHPHEQTGYLVSGGLELTVDSQKFTVSPGDSWSIPSNAGHSAVILEDSVAIEVFSPVREDYLPS